MEYNLLIFEPGSSKKILIQYHSTFPFIAISKGDLLDPRDWGAAAQAHEALRVTEVKHSLWGKPKPSSSDHDEKSAADHRILVFTEEVNHTG